MEPKPTATLLFHLSDEHKESIAPNSNKRPVFYWFNDCYFDHIPGETPAYKYLYLFIVKPDSGVKLFIRHGNGDFASLWADYRNYLKARAEDRSKNANRYLEPAIVMSFNELVPAVTCELSDDFEATVIKPKANYSFSLKENGRFRDFANISKLVEFCPELMSSVPIIQPSPFQLDNSESFWAADFANEGRSWL